MQAKRLLQLLRNCKRKVNGFSPSVLEEDPSGVQGISECPESDEECRDLPARQGPSRADLEHAQYFHSTGAAGSRSSRASTVTTFISSTPDGSSTHDLRADSSGLPVVEPETLPQRSTDSSPPCKNCQTGKNGISRYALTVLTRQLAHNHVLGKDISPDTEEFPRILHSHEETCNNNKISMREFIPTVYGEFCDNLLGDQDRELQELGGAAALTRRRASTESLQAKDRKRRRRNSSEKLNFIMYI